jgi:hypothetical protein
MKSTRSSSFSLSIKVCNCLVLAMLDSSNTKSRFWPSFGCSPRARCRCNVCVSMLLHPIFALHGKSERVPLPVRCSFSASRTAASEVVFPVPATPSRAIIWSRLVNIVSTALRWLTLNEDAAPSSVVAPCHPQEPLDSLGSASCARSLGARSLAFQSS